MATFKMLNISALSSVDNGLEPELLSDAVCRIFQWVILVVLCVLMQIFGIVTNVINIICFIKQGFKEPLNVSLLGLAISDLGLLANLVFTCLCCIPIFDDIDMPFEPLEFQYMVTAWLHVIFTRITSLITAIITLERCLCVTMPLKVKSMITTKRTTKVIVSVFVILFCCGAPFYYANGLGYKFSSRRNKTILGLVYSDLHGLETVSITFFNVIIPFGSFAFVVVCTAALVAGLRSKTQWREQSMVPGGNQRTVKRDLKLGRMIVAVSTLFIVCLIPVCISFVCMMMIPGLAVDGKYKNILMVLFSFPLLFESTNSATNIFIYYRMSSKYRASFRLLFGLPKLGSAEG